MAEDVNFPPCLLLRLVLDHLGLGLGKEAVKAVMAAPACLPSRVQVPPLPVAITTPAWRLCRRRAGTPSQLVAKCVSDVHS